MNLCCLIFLILCYAMRGWTEDAIESDDGPLTTSIPGSDWKDDPDHLVAEALTVAPDDLETDVPTPGQKDGSSEEDLDTLCDGVLTSQQIKRAVGNGIMKLGLSYLESLKPSPELPNVIISPLSLSVALSQLMLGATNETEELLLHHLHADELPCYHTALSTLLRNFQKKSLAIASRIYLQTGFEPKPEFMEDSLKLYDSEPGTLSTVDEVNEWVKKATNGHISEFLASLPANTVMMLINAMHFKGEWLTRFDPKFTSNEFFYVDGNQIVNVDMMLGVKYPLSVFTHLELDAQVARFPFKFDRSLLVVMPTSGQVNMSAIVAKFNISDVYTRFPRERNMPVKLPKFKLEFNQDLKDAMTSMGLGMLFGKPKLSRISDDPLFVSSVQHMSSVEINEEGAEAAAATSVIISRSNLSFTVNQPFFFAIMDDSSQTPLFMGVITNPNPGASTIVTSPGDSDKKGFSDDKPFDVPPK
ncbi:serpin peptidase inhibitor, clade F (alpha-2 antiplasmin, pigment epithelium derived factor), member 2b [Triplophysa rosa]|uniref:serpin peptidase inhibitor, clade F (alpha-2 antiplasmin, pigment epithelium derived factor), member 2b n=1 Tax=Triplophysa rosa TaxID=992332 RepID=UPI002546109A|nr:serpin peptidase inhibitor, clade F (alpha-2 antiplasmin, pigment epithelium derived factor), member 2b [Triplophysa rosa]XP_057207313.1 serpin peptidase inhibitor, clade F (alpha-2 antiplasmin, pigment epithelium derived factor), member 2b [Triplophysa rosa]